MTGPSSGLRWAPLSGDHTSPIFVMTGEDNDSDNEDKINCVMTGKRSVAPLRKMTLAISL